MNYEISAVAIVGDKILGFEVLGGDYVCDLILAKPYGSVVFPNSWVLTEGYALHIGLKLHGLETVVIPVTSFRLHKTSLVN